MTSSVGPVFMGCKPTEVVIRGGYLKQPLVLTGLSVVGGQQFFGLAKTSRVLNRFLCKEPLCKRPLARTLVIEKLAILRNDAYQKALAETKVSQEVAVVMDHDLTAGLNLDMDTDVMVASESSPGKRRVSNRRFLAQMPSTVRVLMDRADSDPWEPVLLAEPATKAPSMEASAENFASLFALVDADVSNGDVRREAHGTTRDELSRRGPRGPKDARQYFIRGKWITKIPKDRVADEIPYVRSFRTLKRWGTDEGHSRGRKHRSSGEASGRGRGRGMARPSRAKIPADGGDMDCLAEE